MDEKFADSSICLLCVCWSIFVIFLFVSHPFLYVFFYYLSLWLPSLPVSDLSLLLHVALLFGWRPHLPIKLHMLLFLSSCFSINHLPTFSRRIRHNHACRRVLMTHSAQETYFQLPGVQESFKSWDCMVALQD